MYKVFNNNNMIKVVGKADFADDNTAAIVYLQSDADLMDCIINQIINPINSDLTLVSENIDRDTRQFENQFKVVVAAGGWVFDGNGRLLMIQRSGFWDIPKGHLEKNEKLHHCALREVEEETMAHGLKLEYFLGESNHIYLENGNFCIKKTHWYKMSTSGVQVIKPQLEEGITKAEWVEVSRIGFYLDNAWRSIREFYHDYVFGK